MIDIQTIPVGHHPTNCYIVTDCESRVTAVIDPGDFSKQLDEALSDLGYDNVKYIVLTHGHYDHIGGVNDILEKCSAKVLIGEHDVPFLSDNYLNLSASVFPDNPYAPIRCDTVLHDGDVFTLGKSSFKVIGTPGHTAGSICLIGEGVIFSGDTVFFSSYGRTDLPTGNMSQMMQSLKKIGDLDGNYKIYTGHGQATTLVYEQKNNPYFGRVNYEDIY